MIGITQASHNMYIFHKMTAFGTVIMCRDRRDKAEEQKFP